MTIEDRVQQLEQQNRQLASENRWIKRVGLSALMAFATVLTVGAQQQEEKKEDRPTRLALYDEKGNARATIAVLDQGAQGAGEAGGLVFLDVNNRVRTQLRFDKLTTTLTLYTANGQVIQSVPVSAIFPQLKDVLDKPAVETARAGQ